MTFRNLIQEHKIVTNIPSNDFKLPKINNLDMNAENNEADPNIQNQEIVTIANLANHIYFSSSYGYSYQLNIFQSLALSQLSFMTFGITQLLLSPHGPIPTANQTFLTRPHPLILYSIPNIQGDEFKIDDDNLAVIGGATHVYTQPSSRIPVIFHPIEQGNNSDMVELFENWNLSGGNFTIATGGVNRKVICRIHV
ncbi:hypothetical protein G9A89_016638 [Geosiphon pyriformis]|nr:hypothetical protein G9A89_016638 [Geosiphon pyriformis]